MPAHHCGGQVSRIDRYPTRPRSAAPHGAMQVTVSGNNVGETTSLLSRASSDGARCTTLAAGYDNHRWKELKQDDELLMIPVIMLTTSQAEEDIVRSYSLHANAFITKPVDFEHFIDAIRQIDTFFLTLVKLPPDPRLTP